MLDISKSNRQEQGIAIWKSNNYKGTLNYVQRFGKTRIIELITQRTRENNPSAKLLLLVPTDIAFQNVKYLKDKYNILCYTKFSFKNAIDNGTFNLFNNVFILIIDEIHRFLSEKDIILISKIKPKFTLGLTGSKLSWSDNKILNDLGFPVIDIISEEEAIENNWISDYDEYNVSVNISDSDKIKLKSLTDNIDEKSLNFKNIYKKVNEVFKYDIFKSDFELIQSCFSGKQLYVESKPYKFITPDDMRIIVAALMGFKKDAIIVNDYIKQIQTFWHPDNIYEMSKSYIKAVKARNDYLKYNVSKVNAVLELSNYITKPTIIYNDSIEMIDHLSSAIKRPNVKYHSQMESVYIKDKSTGDYIRYTSGEKEGQPKVFGKTYLKKLALTSIKDGSSLFLITGRSLNESLDLPNIEYIICTAGDTSPTTYDQRVARGKTIDVNNKNKKCIIINLFIDDFIINGIFVKSRDKEKLMIRQNNVKNVIWLENLSDLFCSIN